MIVHKCKHCPKIFKEKHFLLGHIKRRHFDEDISEEQPVEPVTSTTTPFDYFQIQKEATQLKFLLSEQKDAEVLYT